MSAGLGNSLQRAMQCDELFVDDNRNADSNGLVHHHASTSSTMISVLMACALVDDRAVEPDKLHFAAEDARDRSLSTSRVDQRALRMLASKCATKVVKCFVQSFVLSKHFSWCVRPVIGL
jgi:hypothetical protein